MTERVKKAIDIFLDALNNGTLAKGTCKACAVGNLVADSQNGIISKTIINIENRFLAKTEFECTTENYSWNRLFVTKDGKQFCFDDSCRDKIVDEIKLTGFTLNELMQIEFAFETNTLIDGRYYNHCSLERIRQDQINGLAAVVKVMLSFESDKEIEDSEVKEIFTSKAELIPIA